MVVSDEKKDKVLSEGWIVFFLFYIVLRFGWGV